MKQATTKKAAAASGDDIRNEVDALKKQLQEATSKIEDATVEDFVNSMTTPYGAKDLDTPVVGSQNIGGYASSIGQDIDIGTLHRLFVSEGWFYIVVSTIAKTIAALPLKIEKRQVTTETLQDGTSVQKETWVDASGEPEAQVFKFPNDMQTSIEFYMLVLIDLLATGNFFIYVHEEAPVQAANPFRPNAVAQKVNKTLFRLNPSLITPLAAENGKYLDGYGFNSGDGYFKFNLKEIIHVKMPNPVDPFLGLAPVVPVLKNVLLDRHTTEHMIRFYRQGARLGGVIKTTQKLSKEQLNRLQRSFDSNYTGRQNHHRTLILPQGMEYDTIEQNPGETALIEFCKANREPILSAYNVPPVKVGLLDGATFANAMAQQKIFFVDTIQPILTLIEQGLNRHQTLLPPARQLRVRFDLSGIEALQENKKEVADLAKSYLDSGWTPNEVRQELYKKGKLAGGDKSPVIEKLTAPAGGFPIFNMSAQGGDEKDLDSDQGSALAGAFAHLSGPQVTAAMNVIGRVQRGRMSKEAGVQLLNTVFGFTLEIAHQLVGLEPPAAKAEPAVPVDPANQQQPVGGTTPTKGTFEERVAQLVAEAVAQGVDPTQATIAAIGRAILEGFPPPAPNTGGTAAGAAKEDPANPEVRPVAVGTAPIVDPSSRVQCEQCNKPTAECECGGKENHGNQEDQAAQEGSKEEGVQEEGRRQEVKHPFSEDDFANHWKAMTSDGIKGLLEERTATTRSFFKHLGELFLKKHAKNLKSFGLNYHSREEFRTKADDDVVDPKELEKFIKAESEKAGEQMMKAMEYGYANTLTTFNLKKPDEAMRQKIQEMAARNVTYVTDTTKNQIKNLLDKAAEANLSTGEISAQMRDYFHVPDNLDEVPLDEGFISAARVQTIVRTETLSAVSAGQAAKNEEFKKEYPEEGKRLQKIWITARDGRVRGNPDGKYADSEADHWKLEGQIVGIDEEFDNGLQYPREADGPAEEVINCRCTWTTFLPEDQEDIEANLEDGGSEAIPAGVTIDESEDHKSFTLPPRRKTFSKGTT